MADPRLGKRNKRDAPHHANEAPNTVQIPPLQTDIYKEECKDSGKYRHVATSKDIAEWILLIQLLGRKLKDWLIHSQVYFWGLPVRRNVVLAGSGLSLSLSHMPNALTITLRYPTYCTYLSFKGRNTRLSYYGRIHCESQCWLTTAT